MHSHILWDAWESILSSILRTLGNKLSSERLSSWCLYMLSQLSKQTLNTQHKSRKETGSLWPSLKNRKNTLRLAQGCEPDDLRQRQRTDSPRSPSGYTKPHTHEISIMTVTIFRKHAQF